MGQARGAPLRAPTGRWQATMKDARGKKWRARSARVQRNASMEYPQLEGLPIYISDDNRCAPRPPPPL